MRNIERALTFLSIAASRAVTKKSSASVAGRMVCKSTCTHTAEASMSEPFSPSMRVERSAQCEPRPPHHVCNVSRS